MDENSTVSESWELDLSGNSTVSESWELDLTGRVIISLIFGSILVVGIAGNLLVVTLILLVNKMHTTVNLCLSSLAVADLIVLGFSPIIPWHILYDVDDSPLGHNFCVFVSSVNRGAMVCSVLTFLLVGVERYTALCHPFRSIGLWRRRKVCLILLVIWVITVAACVPYGTVTRFQGFHDENKTVIYCYIDWSNKWVEWYETALYAVFLFLPIPVLMLLYGKMIVALRAKVPASDTQGTAAKLVKKSRSQIVLMLVVLVSIFILCLLPFKIYILVDIYAQEALTALDERSYFILNWFVRIITYINHASNPIVYFAMSSNFREAFKLVFCKTCSKVRRAVFKSRLSQMYSVST